MDGPECSRTEETSVPDALTNPAEIVLPSPLYATYNRACSKNINAVGFKIMLNNKLTPLCNCIAWGETQK